MNRFFSYANKTLLIIALITTLQCINDVPYRADHLEKLKTYTWTAVATGGYHTLAIRSDGTLWAWGRDSNGQLGDGGTNTDKGTPVQIGTSSWTAVAAGLNHSLAIRSDGSLWAWGQDASGQLGDNVTIADQNTPVLVDGVNTYIKIAAGDNHSLAIRSDGSLWAWGADTQEQLGDGAGATNQPQPVAINAGTSYSQIAAGSNHSLAIRSSDSKLFAWGDNGFGQLGDSAKPADANVPVAIDATNTYKLIAAGSNHSLGILSTAGSVDSLWVWGRGLPDSLCDGAPTTDFITPTQINPGQTYLNASGGGAHTLVIHSDGTRYACGTNTSGQIGDGAILTPAPANVTILTQIDTQSGWKQISAGFLFSAAIRSDGTLWMWGDNSNGQIGNGNAPNDLSSPYEVKPK